MIIHIGRMYYKGVIMSRTQDAARNIVDNIARPIQLHDQEVLREPLPPGEYGSVISDEGNHPKKHALCVGDQLFSFVTDMMVDKDVSNGIAEGRIRHGIWKSQKGPTGCSPVDLSGAIPSGGGEDLLPEKMRLNSLEVTNITPSGSAPETVWQIIVDVSYGEIDDMDNNGKCKAQVSSSQFCANARYETTVVKRVKN